MNNYSTISHEDNKMHFLIDRPMNAIKSLCGKRSNNNTTNLYDVSCSECRKNILREQFNNQIANSDIIKHLQKTFGK